MRFYPDQGRGPVSTPIRTYSTDAASDMLAALGWRRALVLNSGFTPSYFTICIEYQQFLALNYRSTLHRLGMPGISLRTSSGNALVDWALDLGDPLSASLQEVEELFTGFYLSDFRILDPAVSTRQAVALVADLQRAQLVDGIEFDSTAVPSPRFKTCLFDLAPFRNLSIRGSVPGPNGTAPQKFEPLVVCKFSDVREWWSKNRPSRRGYNLSSGVIPRVPGDLKNLFYETPVADPSFLNGESNNPPQTYPNQHNPTALFQGLSGEALTAAQDALKKSQDAAWQYGGLLDDTNQVSKRPLAAQRPQTLEGERPLSWREVLIKILEDLGALVGLPYDLEDPPANLPVSTWIDFRGFQAPNHPRVGDNQAYNASTAPANPPPYSNYGPPPIHAHPNGAWAMLAEYLTATGHTLEPDNAGRFRVIPIIPNDANDGSLDDNFSNRCLARVLRFITAPPTSGPSTNPLLTHLTYGDLLTVQQGAPLPIAYQVFYPFSPGEAAWTRNGNPLERGKHLPHAIIPTEWLISYINNVSPLFKVLTSSGLPLTSRLSSGDYLNAPIPKLTAYLTAGAKTLYAPLGPQQPYLPLSLGDDLTKTNPGEPAVTNWGPHPSGSNIPVFYSNPAASDTYYRVPSWLLYPDTSQVTGNQALPDGLFPLPQFAQAVFVASLIAQKTLRFSRRIALLPDRYCQSVIHHFDGELFTDVYTGVPLPGNVGQPTQKHVALDPPQTIVVQFEDYHEKNLTALAKVREIQPAMTANAQEGYVYPELTIEGTQYPTPGVEPVGYHRGDANTPAYVPGGSETLAPNREKPYWRINKFVLVVENLLGRAIRPQEIVTLHRTSSGNYCATPDSSTTLGVAEVLSTEGSPTNEHPYYQAKLLRVLNGRRVRAFDAKTAVADDFFNTESRTIWISNPNRLTRNEGDILTVALAGYMTPWPALSTESATIDTYPSLFRPLGEADLGEGLSLSSENIFDYEAQDYAYEIWEEVAFSAGEGGGGTTSEMVLVLEDLPGYQVTDLRAAPQVVKAIPRVWQASVLVVDDTAPLIDVYFVQPNKIALDSDGCCGDEDGGGSANGIFGGIYLNRIGNDNIIAQDSNAVVISGGGVAPSSSVTLLINGSISLVSGPSTFQVSNEGTFSVTVNLSAVAVNTFVTIRATETTQGSPGIALEPRTYTIYKRDNNYGTQSSTWFSNVPSRPALATGQDTGRSASDNWTSTTNPVLVLKSTNPGYAAGHGIRIYVDGVLEFDAFLTANPDPPSGLSGYTINLQPGTLSTGLHLIQWQETYQDGRPGPETGDVFGPVSDPLFIRIDPAETGTAPEASFEFSDVTYGRFGVVDTYGGKKTLTSIGSCPVKLTAILSDRVAGYIVGTGVAAGNFTASSSSVNITAGTFTIINDTEDPDPDPPTSLSLAAVNMVGSTGDILSARWKNDAWEIRGVRTP